jgi:uncharacterized Zn finger protein
MISTCMRCGAEEFGTTTVLLERSRLPMLVVQCTGCGGVVGVTYDLPLPAPVETPRRPLASTRREVTLSILVPRLGQDDRC